MSYRIIIAACLFPTVACAGPVAIGGANGFSVASNGAVVSVLNSPSGFTVSGHHARGLAVHIGRSGSRFSIGDSFVGRARLSAISSTAAAVVSAPSGTVAGAFGIGTISSANSNAGN